MKLVFVAYIRTHIVSLLPQARWLASQGMNVTFYLASKKCMNPDDRALVISSGLKCILHDGSSADGQDSPLWHSKRDPVGFSYRRPDSCWRQIRRATAFYDDLITRWKANVLILPEENVGYMTNVLVHRARAVGIPSMVMPYTLDNPLEAAEAYYQSPHFLVNNPLRRLFAARYPHWVRNHKGVQLFRLPFWAAVMTQYQGFAPSNPWQNTCSFASRVLLESDAARRAYASSGIPDEKFAIIGSTVHDRMAAILSREAENRAELLQELGLDPKRPVFLAAIPPDQFNTERAGCEFASHAEIVSFWLETLAATGWNVIVNLHPHLKPEKIDFGAWPNVKYCARPTAEVIPLCDVFVASISATIRWAVACGKTVINHDLYLYRYDDYHGAPGVIHLETKAAFAAEVARVSQDTPTAIPHSDWGILDGKSGERLKNLL